MKDHIYSIPPTTCQLTDFICLFIVNFNYLASVTLTFSYSNQLSYPLMCDLLSVPQVVNLGWQWVVPC